MPVRQFSQARARKTFEALVEAAAALFIERGFDGTQSPDIAAAAGVSVGTFYRYFADKKEIYLETTRRELIRAHEEVMAGLTPERFIGKERRATVEEALHILINHITRSPARQRVFLEMALRDKQVGELQWAFERAAIEQLSTLIAAVCSREAVSDPEATAYVIHTAVVACANQIAGAHGVVPVSRERATTALTDLILNVLFAER